LQNNRLICPNSFLEEVIEVKSSENKTEEISVLDASKDGKKAVDINTRGSEPKCNAHVKECFIAFFILGSAAMIGFAVYYAVDHAHEAITAENNNNFFNTTAVVVSDPTYSNYTSYNNFPQKNDNKDGPKKDCSNDELIKIFIGCFASAVADNLCNKLYNALKDKPKTVTDELELKPLNDEAKIV